MGFLDLQDIRSYGGVSELFTLLSLSLFGEMVYKGIGYTGLNRSHSDKLFSTYEKIFFLELNKTAGDDDRSKKIQGKIPNIHITVF